jgi:hypothetical protein
MNPLFLLVALIPLLLLAPSLSYASVTPQQHKCIREKIEVAMTAATLAVAIGIQLHSQSAGTGVEKQVDNATQHVESCLK